MLSQRRKGNLGGGLNGEREKQEFVLIFQYAKNRRFQQDILVSKAPVNGARRQAGVRGDARDSGPCDTVLPEHSIRRPLSSLLKDSLLRACCGASVCLGIRTLSTLVDFGLTCKCKYDLLSYRQPMNSSDARHPLFNREFRYLWIGNTISGCGDQFFLVALPWLILQLTGSGAVLGGIMMVQAIPRAALMLIGGAVTDRSHPEKS